VLDAHRATAPLSVARLVNTTVQLQQTAEDTRRTLDSLHSLIHTDEVGLLARLSQLQSDLNTTSAEAASAQRLLSAASGAVSQQESTLDAFMAQVALKASVDTEISSLQQRLERVAEDAVAEQHYNSTLAALQSQLSAAQSAAVPWAHHNDSLDSLAQRLDTLEIQTDNVEGVLLANSLLVEGRLSLLERDSSTLAAQLAQALLQQQQMEAVQTELSSSVLQATADWSSLRACSDNGMLYGSSGCISPQMAVSTFTTCDAAHERQLAYLSDGLKICIGGKFQSVSTAALSQAGTRFPLTQACGMAIGRSRAFRQGWLASTSLKAQTNPQTAGGCASPSPPHPIIPTDLTTTCLAFAGRSAMGGTTMAPPRQRLLQFFNSAAAPRRWHLQAGGPASPATWTISSGWRTSSREALGTRVPHLLPNDRLFSASRGWTGAAVAAGISCPATLPRPSTTTLTSRNATAGTSPALGSS
jgi:hypothetical protein